MFRYCELPSIDPLREFIDASIHGGKSDIFLSRLQIQISLFR